MDENVRERSLEAERRALLADNERQRAGTIEAHERALELAKRCDALEAECDALKRRMARRARLPWPFRRSAT